MTALTTSKPKIVLCGIQQQGKDIVDYLRARGLLVTHIVTIDKKKADDTWASYQDLGLPVYRAKKYSLSDPEDLKYFRDNEFDVMLLGGWQRLIPQEVLDTLRLGAIGQHGSPEHLPKGRGRSPINWAIIQGRRRLVWNIFFLRAGIDDGPVIDSQVFEINDFDDCNTVYQKASCAVKYMLARSLPKLLVGTLVAKEQHGSPTYFPKRTPIDGIIDWSASVFSVYNLVRALVLPYPSAFTARDGHRINIYKAQVWDTVMTWPYESAQYGEVVEVFGGQFVVKCEDGLLLVKESDAKVRVGEVLGSG